MPGLIDLDDSNFQSEILESQQVAIVDFGAEWCAPCKKQHPIMEEIAGEMSGQVVAGYLDVGKYPTIAQQYAVMSVPRLIIFKDGNPVDTAIGLQSKDKVKELLDKHM